MNWVWGIFWVCLVITLITIIYNWFTRPIPGDGKIK